MMIFVALLLLVCLAGCSQVSKSRPESPPTETAQAVRTSVAFVPGLNRTAELVVFEPSVSMNDVTTVGKEAVALSKHYEEDNRVDRVSLLVVRAVGNNGLGTVSYNYAFERNAKGPWFRVRDQRELARIRASGI